MTRILVTGITSPLGQAVGRRLQAEGRRVVGTLRSSRTAVAKLPADELVTLDLDKKHSFSNISGRFDAFVHVAAASEGTAEELMTITGLGTLHLIELAHRLGVKRIIHISSMAVYGTISEDVVSEKTMIRQSVPYGAAKWAAECYLATKNNDLEAVSIRSPAIAGVRTHRHFLAQLFNQMSRGATTVSASNPDHLFNNLVHEDILADFINILIQKPNLAPYRAIPVGSKDPMPLREIVARLAEKTSFKGKTNWVEPKSPPFRIDSSGAIELGYQPITTVETIKRWMRDADR